MTKTNCFCSLQPEGTYHLMGRATGYERLFFTDENRNYFLRKYQQHVAPVADTYAWCLLPNHFHLVVRVRPSSALADHYRQVKQKEWPPDAAQLSDFVMERFGNWLNAYTKAFNKVYSRRGSLFTDYLRRVSITSDRQVAATLHYVHYNPVHHGYCRQTGDWHWSSYPEYCNRCYRWVSPVFVRRFFGTLGAFRQYHDQPVLLKEALLLE